MKKVREFFEVILGVIYYITHPGKIEEELDRALRFGVTKEDGDRDA